MAVYTGRRGRAKLDLELLSRGNASISQAEYEDVLLRLNNLEAQNATLLNIVSSVNSVDNLLLNSDFAYSTNAFTGSGSTTELYKWYFGADMANPITTTSSPSWDAVNGNLNTDEITAAKDIGQNFSKRVILPGITYYVTLLAKKLDATPTPDTKLYAGIWDKGNSEWLTGTLQGSTTGSAPDVAPVPGSGGATTYKYKVVAITDTGNTVVSDEATITNSFAVLDATHYNTISWSVTSGVLSYQVYRTFPSVAYIATLPAGNSSYNDVGTNITAPATVPTANPPLAKVEFSNFGVNLSAAWQVFRASIVVPGGYDINNTAAGDQWFRLQLSDNAPVEIQFDRIGLSTLPGGWAAAFGDNAATGDIVITPVGDGGAGGVGIDPYNPGSPYDPYYYGYGYGF